MKYLFLYLILVSAVVVQSHEFKGFTLKFLYQVFTGEFINLKRRDKIEKNILKNETSSYINYLKYADTKRCFTYDVNETEKKDKRAKCIKANGNGTLYMLNSLNDVMQLLAPSGSAIKSENPGNCAIILFYTKFCPGCHTLVPHWNSLARNFLDIKVGAIDALEHPGLNTDFGIIGLPSIIIFHQGRMVQKFNTTQQASVTNVVNFIQKHTNLMAEKNIVVTSEDFSPTNPLRVSMQEDSFDGYLVLSWTFIIKISKTKEAKRYHSRCILVAKIFRTSPIIKTLGIRCLSISFVKNSRLAEVGKLQTLKTDGNYLTGQLFLHKVFGYRGVVLFPWTAKVYDRDNYPEKNTEEESTSITSDRPAVTNKEVLKRTHTYYQVLIDQRDCPFIRAQTEAVTFLGNNQESSRSLYAIPGLDYVSHSDIIPYQTFESTALSHELFDKFLTRTDSDPPFTALETLKAWQKKNHTFLELSDVHIETTNSIRITVIPFFMGCRETPSSSVYWWRYCIRLENLGDLSCQLRERHWRIFSLSGTLETVRGRGIVGQEPILNSRLPAFQYSSHVSLQAPSGHMWGTFRMEREDGLVFDVRIPPFSLESKSNEDTEDETT